MIISTIGIICRKYFQLRNFANRTKRNTFFDIRSDVMWCDVMWCDVMWCDVMWCDVMWCDVMWCDVMGCDGMRCDVLCCDVMWCDVVMSMLMLLILMLILHIFGSRLNPVVGCDMVYFGITKQSVGPNGFRFMVIIFLNVGNPREFFPR